MSFFHRLFSKKPKNQDTTEPEQIQEIQPTKESPEKENTVVEQKLQMDDNPVAKNEVPGEQKPQKEKPETEKTASTQLQPWRTFSIFISSTFADMQAERDHLKNVVFPLVEEELQKRRIKLEIVDLRWGVDTTSMTQEDEREANVLKVCLDEIRRCRPFFIGLLGDRYGWVPPLERMKTALVGEKHLVPEKGKSVTDLEIEFGVLASKEQLVRSVFYFREPLHYETFSKKKAGMFSDEYNNELSETERNERKTALEKLKARIVDHFTEKKLENKVKSYSGIWDAEKEKLTGLETWGDTVYADILAECESHAKATWDKVPQNWQEQELALLDAFIETNTTTFCGRKPLLEELKQHLLTDNTGNWGLVLTGESGSGKSAVFSMTYKMMQQENCFILAHSAGLSQRAKSVADLLRIWNKQLAEHLGINEELPDETKRADDLASRLTGEQGKETTTPIEKLQEKFLELLHLASAKKRVVLLIDALDRFEPTARAQHLSWLPSLMPQNVRLLCTAITGTEQKAVQYHKGLKAKSMDVFSTAEAKEMLDALCLRLHKSLPAKIEKIILEKKRADGQSATTSPLWLSLAVNMLMAIDHDDFEKMSKLEGRGDQQIESYLMVLANGFDPLPGALFLSLKSKAGLLFGDSFTAAVFKTIAISRNGLREKDLEKILPTTNIAWDPLKFANLRRWFKAHLVLQGEELQWNLAHSILRSALTEQVEETQRKKLHSTIAEYLMPLHNDPLKATEAIYHLINAGNYKEAALYYSSDLTDEEAAGATTILAEIITADEKGLVLVSTLPGLVVNEFESFYRILKRFVFKLNSTLGVEGNLTGRLILLEKIEEDLRKTYASTSFDEGFRYDTAAIYGKLGEIHDSMGHTKEALKYFENYNQLTTELYEANPRSESLKDGLAISYSKLGEIHQSMGHMEEALKYFKNFNQLLKELCEANPRSVRLKNGFGCSHEQLGEIHQSMGHMEEALKYFENYNQITTELYQANPLSEGQKNALASSYEKLGSIHQSMGHMEEALKYFENYNQLTKELYQANPRSEGLKNGFGRSYEKLGIIHQSMGHMEEALKYFEYSNQISKELYEANPRNESQKNGLAISYQYIGYIHQSMGHMEEALKYFENYNQLTKELYEANLWREELKNGLAISNGLLGDIHQSMGHMEEALKYFEKFNQITKELYEVNPLNESLKNGLAISCGKFGDIHQSMGNMGEALKYSALRHQYSKELYEANPYNEELKNNFAISYGKLGEIFQSLGHMEEALNYYKNFNQLTKELYDANPRNESLKNGLAISNGLLGDIHQSMGHKEEALNYFENYNQLSKEFYEANPLNEELKNNFATSYGKLGEIHQSMGHMEEALKYFENDLELTKELYEANPRNINLLEGLGISYYKLAMLYKANGNNTTGKERFAEWKKIISFLAKNLPQVQKYRDWDKIEY